MRKITAQILKITGRLAKALVVTGLSLLLFFLLLIAGFLLIPEFHLQSDQLRWVADRYLPANLEIRWNQADLHVYRRSLLRKHVVLTASEPCVRWEGEAAQICFDRLQAGAVVGFRDGPPRVLRVDPLIATGGDVGVDLTAFPEGTEEVQEQPDPPVWKRLRDELIAKWDVEGTILGLRSLQVKTEDGLWQGGGELVVNRGPDGRLQGRFLLSEVRREEGFPRFEGRVDVIWPMGPPADRRRGRRPAAVQEEDWGWRVKAAGLFEQNENQRVDVKAGSVVYDWSDFSYQVESTLHNYGGLDRVLTTGQYRDGAVDGRVSLRVRGLQGQLEQFELNGCGYHIGANRREARLECRPQEALLQLRERRRLRAPELFRVQPTFTLAASNIALEGGRIQGDYDLDLELRHAQMLNFNLDVDGRVDRADTMKWTANIDSTLLLSDFQRMVTLLRNTDLAVPAPINVMQGPVSASVQGELNEQGGVLPFRLQPNLKSPSQSFVVDVEGRLNLNRDETGWNRSVTAQADVIDVQMAAPRADVRRLTRVLPDPRFKTLAQKKEEEEARARGRAPFQYDIVLRTVKPGAIRVVTNLTQAPVAMNLNFAASSARDTSGILELLPTPLDILRRDAVLHDLRVEINPRAPDLVSGRIQVRYQEYDIQVILFGTMAEPQITFVSDPPLERNQIISVLIFGRPLGELEEEQRTSVGAAGAALGDAALGFASLWYLAATPVESLSYDPVRRQVSATIGLDEKTTLELGAGGDAVDVGLRRRLGRRWSVNTYVERRGQTEEQVVVAFLEWVRRF